MYSQWTIWLFVLTQITVINAQNPDQYFGIPLGGVHLSQDSTSGELYAYDEYSILINHLEHHPKKPQCTSMMVGPPRPQDAGESLIEGHGVLVSLAHPLVLAPNSDIQLRQRHKRQAGRLFSGNIYRWPVEMDHLLMGPEENKNSPSAAVPLPINSFSGIHIRNLNRAIEGKNITIQANMTVSQETTTPFVETTPIYETTTSEKTSAPMEEIPIEPMLIPIPASTMANPTDPPTTSTTTQEPTTTQVTTQKTTQETTKMSTTNSPTRATRKGLVVTASVRSKTVSPRLQKLGSHVESTAKPVVVQVGPEEKIQGIAELVDVNDVFASETFNSQESNDFEQKDPGYKIDVNYSDLDFIRKINNNDEIRRAPARHSSGIQVFNSADKFTTPSSKKAGQLDSKGTTPLFYVVDDPHRGHRERILQQLLEAERLTTTTTAQPIKPLDPRYVLPEAREQLGIFLLSNGGKLTDYHWFGLYNHCEAIPKHVELVSLRAVDPPREERIMPISGWSHNVSSYRVQILNCNTVLIPGFNFDPEEGARSTTYFVAGIGQFPDNIEKQVKIAVVGERPNSPLRQYKNEDVLLRLPRSYRTFDIDFISVFNTHEQKSYGHVVIPSLLVPPCTDD